MEERITGVMIYYYFVCQRKLWYFIHEISMEAENENVMLGKLLDENSYQRGDEHINIDNVINIDFIKEHKELHEVKKSRAIEEAGIWQVKYYLYYLIGNCETGLAFDVQKRQTSDFVGDEQEKADGDIGKVGMECKQTEKRAH